MQTGSGIRKQLARAYLLYSLLSVWCIAVASGFALLSLYSQRSSPESQPPRVWPEHVLLECPSGVAKLLVFIHPKCPCTSATLSELDRLIAEVGTGLQVVFLVDCPEDLRDDWMYSESTSRCRSMPQSSTVVDYDGKLAREFHATTSGFCLLYMDRKLCFQGGLTTERGHEGESLARVAIRQLLSNGQGKNYRAPVFGCPLSWSVGINPLACESCNRETNDN